MKTWKTLCQFILFFFITTAILISGCATTLPPGPGGYPVHALLSLESQKGNRYVTLNNEFFEPVRTDGTARFQFDVVERPPGDYVFKLNLVEGIEYVDGDFQLEGDEYVLEPVYTPNGTLEKTSYWFELKGVEPGIHRFGVDVILKDDGSWVEGRGMNLCVAESVEEAYRLCIGFAPDAGPGQVEVDIWSPGHKKVL